MTIICSQDGCPRPYHNFNSFAKHLHRDHQSTTTFMDNVTFQPNDHSLSDAYETGTSSTVETSDYVPVQTAIPSETVAFFVAKIYRSSNTTLMDVAKTISCTQEVLERTVDNLKQSTTTLLNNLQVPLCSESV